MELWPCRFKQELVVGNVSKWLEEEEREGMATHKWMLYVRGGKHNPDISAVVSRVEVGLPVFVLSQVAFFFFRSSCTPPTLRTTWSRSQLPRSTSHAEDGVRFSSFCTQHVFLFFIWRAAFFSSFLLATCSMRLSPGQRCKKQQAQYAWANFHWL